MFVEAEANFAQCEKCLQKTAPLRRPQKVEAESVNLDKKPLI